MAVEMVAPAVRRVQRPGWRDPRLGMGVVLVAASVGLGTWAVAGADRAQAVYVAREVLTPGEMVEPARLVATEARLPRAGERYLRADEPLPDELVVTRVVGEGELVPVAALGSKESVSTRPVSVLVEGSLSSGVVEGAVVELWSTPKTAPTSRGVAEPADPVLVAQTLRVADVREEDGLFAGAAASAVEVLVPQVQLPAVLRAMGTDAALTLVPLPGHR